MLKVSENKSNEKMGGSQQLVIDKHMLKEREEKQYPLQLVLKSRQSLWSTSEPIPAAFCSVVSAMSQSINSAIILTDF